QRRQDFRLDSGSSAACESSAWSIHFEKRLQQGTSATSRRSSSCSGDDTGAATSEFDFINVAIESGRNRTGSEESHDHRFQRTNAVGVVTRKRRTAELQ